MIKAILFDFNGVIINDEPLQMRAYQAALKDEGVALSEAEYYECLGMDDRAFVRAAYERTQHHLTDEKLRAVIERKTALHREMIKDELPLFPGVETFVKACARHLTVGLVSMARRAEVDYVLERAKLRKAFDVIVSAEDVTYCKPHPECYQKAFKLVDAVRNKAGAYPLVEDECLAIEDAPPGIQAARAAGLRTLGVTNTVTTERLRAAGADVVTRSLADWTVDAVRHVFDYVSPEIR